MPLCVYVCVCVFAWHFFIFVLTEFLCFDQEGATSPLTGNKPLKLIDQFTYLSSNISSTEGGVNMLKKEGMNCYWKVVDHMDIQSFR